MAKLTSWAIIIIINNINILLLFNSIRFVQKEQKKGKLKSAAAYWDER